MILLQSIVQTFFRGKKDMLREPHEYRAVTASQHNEAYAENSTDNLEVRRTGRFLALRVESSDGKLDRSDEDNRSAGHWNDATVIRLLWVSYRTPIPQNSKGSKKQNCRQ